MLFLILLGFLLYPPAVLAEIRVDFEDESYGMGRHWKALASFSEHAGLDSVKDTYHKPGEARVFFWDLRYRDGRTLKRMDPIDYNSENEIRVKDMAFYINGFYAGKLEGEELLQAFAPNEQVEAYETDTGSLGLLIKGEDSQLIPTEYFQEFYSGIARQYARTGIFYLIPLLAAAVFVAEFYRRRIWKGRESRFFLAVDTVLYAAGVAAIVLVLIGAFTGSSELNPDESESIYSVQYYIGHLMPPDARTLSLDAYSAFGTARLTELNLFYIFAAQIARLFTFEHGTRLFSVLMFAGLMYFLFWNLKKNRFLLCALFLTPQVWYLYTYCTSDALDFAVGVLVLYQIANPDSMLHGLAGTEFINAASGSFFCWVFCFPTSLCPSRIIMCWQFTRCACSWRIFSRFQRKKGDSGLLCICVLREQLFCFWESAIFRNLSITESNAAGCFGKCRKRLRYRS